MHVTIQRLSLVGAGRPPGNGDALECGVAQIQESDPRGTVVKVGAVAIVMWTALGERVDLILDPNECVDLGNQLIASSCFAAGAPPPFIGAEVGAIAAKMIQAHIDSRVKR